MYREQPTTHDGSESARPASTESRALSVPLATLLRRASLLAVLCLCLATTPSTRPRPALGLSSLAETVISDPATRITTWTHGFADHTKKKGGYVRAQDACREAAGSKDVDTDDRGDPCPLVPSFVLDDTCWRICE